MDLCSASLHTQLYCAIVSRTSALIYVKIALLYCIGTGIVEFNVPLETL